MASLNRLPDELILQIASHVRESDNDSSSGLFNLSLVSRKLRQVAQEVLYKSLWLTQPKGHNRMRVGQLIRTMIERPDLGESVLRLRIETIFEAVGHTYECQQKITSVYRSKCRQEHDNCHDGCICGWEKIEQILVRNFKKRPHLVQILDSCCECRIYESRLVQLLLLLLPSLESLSILPFCVDWRLKDILIPQRMHLDDDVIFPTYPAEKTAGKVVDHSSPSMLNQIRSIYTHRPLPWSIMRITTLKNVEVALLSVYKGSDQDWINTKVLGQPQPLPNIETFVITIEGRIHGKICHRETIFQYYKTLMGQLPSLKHATIRVRVADDAFRERRPAPLIFPPVSYISFARLLDCVNSPNLETLVIDPTNVVSGLTGDGFTSSSFHRFPKLKTLSIYCLHQLR
ncbi:hypothetical protein BDV96DRAFT_679806 [Lophiotrema nucula]|uniref:F-box domain-containing protein n=1 Tax=Lophiotrema nucula TaxID=690887 RepID=A0A6A5ZHS6_9PLEO|nr:hypothetical protein BDV96DRAFT_679806 [Lophiotrema nucula]